jgi:uncharacterized protein (DUF2062 family)
MTTRPSSVFLRPVVAGFVLGLLGAIILPLALSGLWQASGLVLVGSFVGTVLSGAAIVVGLAVCWRALTYKDRHERIKTQLEQIDLDEE